MVRVLMAALFPLVACQGAPDGDAAATPLRRSAVGVRHPRSGAFSPVHESQWASAGFGAGARYTAGEGSSMQVAVYSGHATRMLLEIHGRAAGADAIYDYWMQKGPDSIWRAQIAQVPGKTLYAFRAWGPNWPFSPSWRRGNSAAGFVSDVDAQGNRFNPNKLLFDPYARELSHDKTSAALRAAGETPAMFGTGGANVAADQVYAGPSTANQSVDRRNVDTGRWAPKAVALGDASAAGARPFLPAQDSVIYEAHLRGLTRHPSAARLGAILRGVPGFEQVVDIPDRLRGTYQGAALMAPYLKALGFTTIELMPVQESDNELNPATGPGGNFWGYMTYGFFAPDRRYSSDQSLGGPTREFKQMVAAFHAAGLEVYLDVVYNHSGEGGTWDVAHAAAEVTSLRGLDNAAYYALAADRSAYFDSTGVGNNLDVSQAPAAALIEASLLYWTVEMGVDGFRFDEAAELGRGPGPAFAFDPNAPLLTRIAALAAAQRIRIIAEPWDNAVDEEGRFPPGWSEWNGYYRDAVRRYLKGDASGSGGVSWADAFYGDYDHFFRAGGPQLSINLLDAHDGFTLADLVSYDGKTNAARSWPFGPSGGGIDVNDSWDYGGDQALRRQALRNAVVFQALSRGVPMLVYGDELGRTQNGNNNPYDVDSVATWNNYDMIASDAPQTVPTLDASGGTESYHDNLGKGAYPDGRNHFFFFVRAVLLLRRAHAALRQPDYAMPISFSRADGASGFDSHADLMGRIQLSGSAVGDHDLLVLSNMSWTDGAFVVPAAPAGARWVRLIDTAAWAEPVSNFWAAEAAATIASGYTVHARSLVLLEAVPAN